MPTKIEIKNCWSGAVIFTCYVPDEKSGMAMRYTLEKAVTTGADLRGADLTGADEKALRATPEQSIQNLDKVRGIILDNADRLEMGHWHSGSEWLGRTCAEEAVCETTHCLAGWLQVCSDKPEIREMAPQLAGILCAPVAGKMFFSGGAEVTAWLESRVYVTEAALWE